MKLIFILISAILGYFLGSLPTALITGKIVKGIDLREYGSKNLGATNAGRVLGRKYFFIVLFIDAFKCILSMLLSYVIYLMFFKNIDTTIFTIAISLAGTSAMIGHCYPIFAQFKGGKGVSTALGYILITSPICGVAIVLTFIITFLIKRYISLSSIMGAIMAILYTWIMYFIFQESYSFVWYGFEYNIGYCIITTVFALTVIIKHHENIKRLINNEEKKFTFKK